MSDEALTATEGLRPASEEVPDFSSFGLDPRLVSAVEALGYTEPTPIQAAAIPALVSGRDVIGRARTGSGKTAAFALPILNRVLGGGPRVRALILAPTRELALQVTDAFVSLAGDLSVSIVPIYGGTSYTPQLRALSSGATIVVGTPGRLLDHVDRGTLDLSALEVLVLDEADEMLRMGFLEDVERLLSMTPRTRQVALFSATLPDPIRRIASGHLRDPLEVQVERTGMVVTHIGQQWVLVPGPRKTEALVRVLRGIERGATLVFARTRAACAEVADALDQAGFSADALHGDLSQAIREQVLGRLRSGRIDVLVATDVAARGIDVETLTHVINYDLPPDIESYVHRIGRTGRAGRVGAAISFVRPAEQYKIKQLERALRVEIEQIRPPSDADISRARQAEFEARLIGTREQVPEHVRAWITDLMARTGMGDAEVASVAVALLSQIARIDLAPPLDEPPPPPRPKKTHKERREADETEVYLSIGRRDGVRPSDLVGALTNERGVTGGQVGRVTILERKSFVGLPRAVAERLVAEERPIVIRGVDVRVAFAKK